MDYELIQKAIGACMFCYKNSKAMEKETDDFKRERYLRTRNSARGSAYTLLVDAKGASHPGLKQCDNCDYKEPRIAKLLERED